MPCSKNWKVILSIILGLFFANISCATNTNPDDPYETYNRHAYAFNQGMDTVLFRPLAVVYNTLLPAFVRKGVNNFFNNLDQTSVIANDFLQLDFFHAGKDVWRFILNSTVGIAGLIDVANAIGFEPHDNDLGLTFAKWGYKSSGYLVLPILGPRTVRDSWGLLGDFTLFTIYPYMFDVQLRNILLAVWLVETRAQILSFESTIKIASFDPYVFQRDAYLQHRKSLIQDDSLDTTEIPSTEEEKQLSENQTISINIQQKTTTNKVIPKQPLAKNTPLSTVKRKQKS